MSTMRAAVFEQKGSIKLREVQKPKPGVGEAFLAERGFDVGERFEVPFVLEFPDPESYARGLAATGPAYEAIQELGEERMLAMMTEHAAERVRDGLPLRGAIQLFGYVGTKR